MFRTFISPVDFQVLFFFLFRSACHGLMVVFSLLISVSRFFGLFFLYPALFFLFVLSLTLLSSSLSTRWFVTAAIWRASLSGQPLLMLSVVCYLCVMEEEIYERWRGRGEIERGRENIQERPGRRRKSVWKRGRVWGGQGVVGVFVTNPFFLFLFFPPPFSYVSFPMYLVGWWLVG